jgi:hypothetical protein
MSLGLDVQFKIMKWTLVWWMMFTKIVFFFGVALFSLFKKWKNWYLI